MHCLAVCLPGEHGRRWASKGIQRPLSTLVTRVSKRLVNLQRDGEHSVVAALEDFLHMFNAQHYRRQMRGEQWVPDKGDNEFPSLPSLVLSLNTGV